MVSNCHPPLRRLTKSVNGALRIHTLKEVESSQLFHQKFLPPCLPFFLKKRRCRHKQHVGCCQGGGGRPPWCHMARALRCFFCNNSLFPSPAVLTRNVSRQQGRGNVALAAITRLGRELAKNVGKEEVDLHSPPEAALLFAMHCICKG